jgi:hypothetical protein
VSEGRKVGVGRVVVDALRAEGIRPGIELVERTEAQERHDTDIYLAAVDWDGSDPIRRDSFAHR